MSRIIKLAAAAIAIAMTATIVAIADDGGRATAQQRSIRYDVSVQAPAGAYRLKLAPGTVIRPGCHDLTWRAVRTETDAR